MHTQRVLSVIIQNNKFSAPFIGDGITHISKGAMQELQKLKEQTLGMDATELIHFIGRAYAKETIFSTSFGIEDQVLTDMISKADSLLLKIFTLDTGRLFPETYTVWNRTVEKYKLKIAAYYPNAKKIEELVTDKGPLSFYNSVEDRQTCCHIRKIEPLKRAIQGYKIWITGLRAEQSTNRENMDWIEWDSSNQIIKIHPLFNWTLNDVDTYLKEQHVPYNALYDKGFPSIGCQPCTRAVREGEDFRSGRWWWEDSSKKECGLHITTK